jgi:predicted GNAT family acetyltransferase
LRQVQAAGGFAESGGVLMPTFHVVRNEEKSRFEVHLGGHLAELEYKLRGERIIFAHTRVPAPLEGQGIGSALVRAGLDSARESGLTVVPQCSFVRNYIERHSEYQDLVKE